MELAYLAKGQMIYFDLFVLNGDYGILRQLKYGDDLDKLRKMYTN